MKAPAPSLKRPANSARIHFSTIHNRAIRLMIGALACSCLAVGLKAGIPLVVPQEPQVKPAIPSLWEVDKDGNLIEDFIDRKITEAQAVLSDINATPDQRSKAQDVLNESRPFAFSFSRQVTLDELTAFVKLGGDVTYIFQVNYGWTGVIARGKIPQVVAQMGPGFLGVIEGKPMTLHMHIATRTGRVRQQWPLGYRGNNNITIAILDTGISATHTDLTGRQQYWHDYTTDNAATAIDDVEHGSHVAGIALGTGNASGVNPTTILYTDATTFPSVGGYIHTGFQTELPAGAATFNWNATMYWRVTGSGKTAGLYYGLYQDYPNPNLSDVAYYTFTSLFSGTGSPITGSQTAIANPYVGTIGAHNVNSRLFLNLPVAVSGPFLGSDVYSTVSTLTAQGGGNFGVGDNFNLESGVAPLCQWAGFKIFRNDGSGTDTDAISGIDAVGNLASTYNLKLANCSFAAASNQGINPTMRSHLNTAAAKGVLFVCSAGNTGPNGSGMADPARSGLALTVGSCNTNQLTDYTTYGFSTGDVNNNEDIIKPDIMAPGGSTYHGAIMSVDSNDADAGVAGWDQRANDYAIKSGTSMAAPFAAGCAALVIDAWQQAGHTWSFASSSDPLFVKMLLCATATESNQGREYDPSTTGPGVNNPTLGRSATPKDPAEGYGMINVDAAIECLRRPPLIYVPISETLGSGRFDKRASGFNVQMTSGYSKTFVLTVPSTADYDLYLYSATPDARGNPVIVASSCTAAMGGTETITYTPSSTGTYYLVVKWVTGSGQFTIQITTPPTFSDIGLLYYGTYTYAYGVNANGEFTGYGDNGYPTIGTVHAFDGTVSGLTTLCGMCSDYGYGHGINDNRMIVGDDVYSGTRGFEWTPSFGYTVLGTVSGWNSSRARAVNNSGVIAGYGQNGSNVNRALRWDAGATIPTDLGTLPGDAHESYAYAINGDGYVVGTSYTTTGYDHPFILNPGTRLSTGGGTDLGTLGGNSGIAYGLNVSRQVVGGSYTSGGTWHAFFKTADSGNGQGYTDLGTLPGDSQSTAYGINKNGLVVGQSSTTHGFVWQFNPNQQAVQSMQNLSTLTGQTVYCAQAVNDSGQIVGWYYNSSSGQTRGFILTPAP